MFDQADVGSIAEIAHFQGAMGGFADNAKQALTTIDAEIRRAVDYIRVDRAQYWQNEIRRSYEAVARAKDDVHRCISFKSSEGFTPSCIDEKKALQRAQERLRIAEEKAEAVKHWSRAIQHELNEYAGRMTQFAAVLENDVPGAMAVLAKILETLDRYVSTRGPGSLENSALERSGSLLESAASITAAVSSMARPTDSIPTPKPADREGAKTATTDSATSDAAKLDAAARPTPAKPAAESADSTRADPVSHSAETHR
jgi:hypothetical protein